MYSTCTIYVHIWTYMYELYEHTCTLSPIYAVHNCMHVNFTWVINKQDSVKLVINNNNNNNNFILTL